MDIITNFFNNYGFNKNLIKSITFGALYISIELQNGDIGVCATLKQEIKEIPKEIDINRFADRVILQAYYNALLNYQVNAKDKLDIFDAIDFAEYKNTVMIGYFRPLAAKFFSKNYPIAIFDLDDDSPELKPINEQKKYLKKAEAVIMSATAITNKSYMQILSDIPNICDVFILGPSSPLDSKILELPNVRAVFGSKFKMFDQNVHQAIINGGGNKSFSRYAEKVGIKKAVNS